MGSAALKIWSRLRSRVAPTAQEREFARWCEDKGDRSLRLEYDLDVNSIVVDIGGFEGQWASDIFGRYCCQTLVFEPVPTFAEALRVRFARNPSVRVFGLGLGTQDHWEEIYVNGMRSSLVRPSRTRVRVEIRRADRFLAAQNISSVDLMKVNIEGAEYDLLEHLLDVDWLPKIRDLQVQFHDFVPMARQRRAAIRQMLARTHYLTYDYPFVWENWRLKSTKAFNRQ